MDSLLGGASNWLLQRRAKQEADDFGRGFNDMTEGASSTFNRMWSSFMGTTQAPLDEVLAKFDMPRGVFPRNTLKYKFEEVNEEGGVLEVTLPFVCEVKLADGTLLRYDEKVVASLTKGCLTNIEGMKVQWVFWMELYEVRFDRPGSDKLSLVGRVKRTKPAALFASPKVAIEVDRF